MVDKSDKKKQKMDIDIEQQLALEEAEQDRADDRRELEDRRKAAMDIDVPERRDGKDRRKKD